MGLIGWLFGRDNSKPKPVGVGLFGATGKTTYYICSVCARRIADESGHPGPVCPEHRRGCRNEPAKMKMKERARYNANSVMVG